MISRHRCRCHTSAEEDELFRCKVRAHQPNMRLRVLRTGLPAGTCFEAPYQIDEVPIGVQRIASMHDRCDVVSDPRLEPTRNPGVLVLILWPCLASKWWQWRFLKRINGIQHCCCQTGWSRRGLLRSTRHIHCGCTFNDDLWQFDWLIRSR